ncbi:hypothetical protein AB0I49_21815 [Streptomyces sp. NPDC050617]|uniref:hypothetical protein n=1 Tax=Streptomyces sp. NPDC050617 TaxID=3154628 RepID=UPI003422DD07
MPDVSIQTKVLEQCIHQMKKAQTDMVHAVEWLEKNFVPLRETLHGEARMQWDSFHHELTQSKAKLHDDYLKATDTLRRMYESQLEGDRNGRNALVQSQG